MYSRQQLFKAHGTNPNQVQPLNPNVQTKSLDKLLKKFQIPRERYDTQRKELLELHYTENQANNVILRRHSNKAVSELISRHTKLLELGYTHADNIKMTSHDGGATSLKAAIESHEELNSLGFREKDKDKIVKILSYPAGPRALAVLKDNYQDLKSFGFSKDYIIKKVAHYNGYTDLSTLVNACKQLQLKRVNPRDIADRFINGDKGQKQLVQALPQPKTSGHLLSDNTPPSTISQPLENLSTYSTLLGKRRRAQEGTVELPPAKKPANNLSYKNPSSRPMGQTSAKNLAPATLPPSSVDHVREDRSKENSEAHAASGSDDLDNYFDYRFLPDFGLNSTTSPHSSTYLPDDNNQAYEASTMNTAPASIANPSLYYQPRFFGEGMATTPLPIEDKPLQSSEDCSGLSLSDDKFFFLDC